MKNIKTTDERFSVRSFEVGRSKNIISVSNQTNNESYNEFIEDIANEYENNELIN